MYLGLHRSLKLFRNDQFTFPTCCIKHGQIHLIFEDDHSNKSKLIHIFRPIRFLGSRLNIDSFSRINFLNWKKPDPRTQNAHIGILFSSFLVFEFVNPLDKATPQSCHIEFQELSDSSKRSINAILLPRKTIFEKPEPLEKIPLVKPSPQHHLMILFHSPSFVDLAVQFICWQFHHV